MNFASSSPILSIVTFLPLAGAIFIAFLSPQAHQNIRYAALWTTLLTFIVALMIWSEFDKSSAAFQFVEDRAWLGPLKYKMGVDGIYVLFIVLTAFLMPIAVIASWESVDTRVKEYMIAFLVLESLMIGVFCALDLLLFYIFFEGGLIPMFLIIGVWGGQQRVYASFKFFLYTLLGSVLMLLAMLAGFGLAVLYYVVAPSLPAATARAFRPLYLFFLNKWYFDELYDWLFVRPAFWLGRLLWKRGDGTVIDGLGPDGIAGRVLWTTGRIVKLQTGYVYHYAFAMLIGVALITTWFMFYGGAGR